jgi:Rad3-related DNA helicase
MKKAQTKKNIIKFSYSDNLFEDSLNFIKQEISKANSDKQIIKAFENIESYKKSRREGLLSELSDYLVYKDNKADFKLLNKFFMKYCSIIRKEINKNPKVDKMLNEFCELNQELTTKYKITLAKAKKAYNKVLDDYDLNKNGAFWHCYFSLVETKNGVLKNVFLYDTADRDIFFDYIEKNS